MKWSDCRLHLLRCELMRNHLMKKIKKQLKKNSYKLNSIKKLDVRYELNISEFPDYHLNRDIITKCIKKNWIWIWLNMRILKNNMHNFLYTTHFLHILWRKYFLGLKDPDHTVTISNTSSRVNYSDKYDIQITQNSN